jgi:hypothetical protein
MVERVAHLNCYKRIQEINQQKIEERSRSGSSYIFELEAADGAATVGVEGEGQSESLRACTHPYTHKARKWVS